MDCKNFVDKQLIELFQFHNIDGFVDCLDEGASMVGFENSTVCYDRDDIKIMLFLDLKSYIGDHVSVQNELEVSAVASNAFSVFGYCNIKKMTGEHVGLKVSAIVVKQEQQMKIKHIHFSYDVVTKGSNTEALYE